MRNRRLRTHKPVRYVSILVTALIVSLSGCDRTERADALRGAGSSAESVAALALSDAHLWSIGGDDERNGPPIGYLEGALSLSDGRVVIADRGAALLVSFYDAQGRYVRSVGGQGDGPGEFRRINGLLRMRGDSVAVWDGNQYRVSVYSPSGDYVYAIQNPLWSSAFADLQARFPRGFLYPSGVSVVGPGSVVFQFFSEPNTRAISAPGMIQDTLPLLALDRAGDGRVDLGWFPGMELYFNDVLVPFTLGETLRIAASNDVILVGSSQNTAVVRLSPTTGELLDSIHLPWPRRAAAAVDRDILTRRMVDGMRADGRARMERYVATIPWPDSLPMFSDLRVGADGRAWVQAFRAPSDTEQEWMAFDADGNPVASLAMDTSWRLLDVGEDYALVEVKDEMDASTVRMYRLETIAGS